MNRDRAITDEPEHGDRMFLEGSMADPKGHWVKYDSNLKQWVRTS